MGMFALAGGGWSEKDMTKPRSWSEQSPLTRNPSFGVAARVRSGGTGRRAERRPGLLAVMGVAALLAVMLHPAAARDRGQYGNTPPELKAWFDSLRSGRGPCCSDADGSAVSDVDWESKNGLYRVRIEGEWVSVPEDAVITTPNRVGRTMVWPIYLDGHPVVRCFMPGSMT